MRAPGAWIGLCTLDRLDHVVPVAHAVGVIDHLPDVVEPRLVRENVANRDVLFARLGELRPVVGDSIVVVEQAAVDQDVEQGSRHPLGGREARRHRIATPGVPLAVLRSAPDVDDAFAVVIDGCGPAAAVAREQAL